MDPAALATAIVVTLIREVGVPLVLRLVAPHTTQEEAHAILDAEYAAIRATSDAHARARFGQ